MKGDVGMSPHEKEGEQEDATPKQKVIHNPIPIHLCLLFICVNILLVKKLSILPAVSSFNNTHIHQKETKI